MQNNITKNVIEHLDINGYLLYVTCSVFKSENEDVVDEIIKNYNLTLIHQQYLEGFEMKADTLFAALLQKKY